MKTFNITIEETYSRIIPVESETVADAIAKAQNIALSTDSMDGYEYVPDSCHGFCFED